MTLPIALTIGFLGAAGLLRATGRLRSDLLGLILLMGLGLAGLVPVTALFSGFSRSAVIVIIALYMLAAGLENTGAIRWITRLGLQLAAGGEGRAVLVVLGLASGLALGLNATVVVSLLLPAVIDLARHRQLPPGRLLIPLAFGAQLGGLATLFATTNILANAALVDQGLPAFTPGEFLCRGWPLALAGLLFMALVGRHWLPARPNPAVNLTPQASLAERYGVSTFVQAVSVRPGSSLAGLSLEAGQWGHRLGLTVIGLSRNGAIDLAPASETLVRAGDVVLFTGFTDAQELEPYGLVVTEAAHWSGRLASARVSLVEVVPAPRATLLGKTLREINFRERYELTALALWREGITLREGLADVPLQLGDGLLLHGRRERLAGLRREADFLVLEEEEASEAPVPRRAGLALSLALAALILPALNVLPIAEAAFTAAALMVLTGCVTIEQAYRAVDWRTVFTIAAILPISLALMDSGAAAWLGQSLAAWMGSAGPVTVAATLFTLAALLTQIVGGPVVAIGLAPVAIAAAGHLGVDAHGLVMAVAWGSSAAFLTPEAHAVNRLVMGPGGYRRRDFIWVGLALIVIILVTLMVIGTVFGRLP